MMQSLKSRIKKSLLLLSGRYKHLKVQAPVAKQWYGNSYGGFFVAPEEIDENSIVYSFGIGEDISFDETIIKKHNCSVFGFDPTPKSISWITARRKSISPRFKFFDYGIADSSRQVDFFLPKKTNHVSGSFVAQGNVSTQVPIQVQMKSLKDIAEQLGHRRIDVLKMDIEGAEYEVLESILSSSIPVGQLLVEFHDRFFPDGRQKTIRAIERLKASNYEIFGVSDSMEEISFIRKK